MVNIREMKEALDKKREPLNRLVEKRDRRVERQAELQRQQIFYRDRERFWNERAEQLEAEAQKARQKAASATGKRSRAERVLRELDVEKDAQERVARAEQIRTMEGYLTQIEKLIEKGPPNEMGSRIVYEETIANLEKGFKSAKGTGV